MGEYYPGEITIGGKVPAALLDEFLSAAASTGASVGDYEEAVFAAGTVEELLKVLDEDGHLRLADAQASYGQFEELEAFCVEHGIPFDRHSDAKYEFDAENVYFRPGMKAPESVPSNNAGDDLFSADAVRPVVKELTKVVTAGLTREKLKAAAVKIIRHLNSLLPPEVEPLPPLEIVK
jgi:hypothetical protein